MATPALVNQHAPSKDYFNKSRYCDAAIELGNGDKDQGFVRIDGKKDPNDKAFNVDLYTVKLTPSRTDASTIRSPSKGTAKNRSR